MTLECVWNMFDDREIILHTTIGTHTGTFKMRGYFERGIEHRPTRNNHVNRSYFDKMPRYFRQP